MLIASILDRHARNTGDRTHWQARHGTICEPQSTDCQSREGSLGAIYDYLLAQPRRDGWPAYHTALAAALVGEIDTARHFFGALRAWPTYGYDWQQQLKRDAASLAELADDPPRLRAAIAAIIERQRAILRLPDDPGWSNTLGATQPPSAAHK
jgi:hypothetical protein